MRFLLAYLVLFNFCQGWEVFTYPQEAITYAGMTIKCDKGCGTYDDTNLQHIWSILDHATEEIFHSVMAINAIRDAEFLRSPVRCHGSGDFVRWDWQAANGVWPSDKNLIRYQEIWMTDYPTFLEIATVMREDIDFYYFTVPKEIREFETSLITKLENGLKQGNNTYRVLPGGDIEFGYKQGNPLYISLGAGWNWIKFQLDYLDYYGFRHKKSVSIQDQKYKQAEDLIEQAIIEMDALFRNIFVCCLKRHQPEGIAFSTAIEALLAGNLTEGIERIRALIKIAEFQQFHPDLIGKMQLLKGQLEIESSLYGDAILSLTEAIAKNQSLKEAYLERATAYFKLGEYDRSMEDYLAYNVQTQGEDAFSILSFTWAFAKNLPPGAYESGKGIALFLSDLVKHPVHTAKQVWESLTLLSKLAVTMEWKELSQALAPEIHYLVVEWGNLTSEKQGELAGYAFGKYGADILIPGALVKAVGKGVRCGTEVSAVYKGLRAADQTLFLESMADFESVAEFTKAIKPAQQTVFLGEELGFTAKEMGQLKQAGKLESAINSGLEKLVSQSESEVLKDAINQNKHVKMVRDYLNKPTKEIQKGINSYEKQIALHKDKIMNPVKHCPDWEKLDPRQREALVNKKWPSEIQVYEQQKNILQAILNERVSYE
ncbi:MAG: hypothetical protein K1X28_05485 [Parachlamydiales bacterium]|nr:hypothetical protein [Parachlamydiales bacterium]